MTTQPSTRRPTAEEAAERMLKILNDAGLALMISVGHRTGLFDALDAKPSATVAQIAERAGLNERYVREWLGAMVTGRIVEHDPDADTFTLPPAYAGCLTRAAAPDNLATMFQWSSVLGSVEDEVVGAFAHGRGVPYSAYKRFHEVMAEESGQTVVAALFDHILPLVPGLVERLEEGIDVLDLGCGSGQAILALAERFSDSRFRGLDVSQDGIARAARDAERRGLTNATFDVIDAARWSDQQAYDLITAFDAIHDQAQPERVLANIHRALRPGGTYLMQDIQAATHMHGNMDHPIGPFVYTISTMHCMSVSLANGGPGLGAAWGKEKALEMLNAAGFEQVRVRTLEHDVQNYYYITQKAPA